MAAAPKARGTPNVPINYDAQLAEEASKIASRIAAPSGDRIRFTGNTAIVTPDGQHGEALDCVIVDFVSTNLLFEGSYDRDNPAPPICFAIGAEPSLLVPSTKSPEPQADTCTVCPNNQFGSAGKGKACKNTRLLALMPVTALDNPDEPAPIWIMSVPPTSLKFFDAYVQSLATRHKTVPIGVITRITLDQSNTFASPRFAVTRPLNGAEFAPFMSRREEATTRLHTEPDVSGYVAPGTQVNTKGRGAPAKFVRR